MESVKNVPFLDALLAKPVAESHSDAAISLPGVFCRNTGVRQSRAIRGSGRRHPLGSILAWRDALGDADERFTHHGSAKSTNSFIDVSSPIACPPTQGLVGFQLR